ncbi:DUF3152 domain-containing protein [Streptomyces sp. NPDC006393]|uniref:DUF3152 domain-containing protein n=1 Tax=Streptomyces sp. NPDC006393 TaxID=3156763 RepID=UPI00340C8B66
MPRFPDGTPAHGVPRFPDGTPAHGVPHFPGGTPAHGVPRFPGGAPAHVAPRLPDGTPAHGVPRLPDGTPAHGVPRLPDGTPAHGVPRARGGHPEQREGGGGWGELGPRAGGAGGAVPGRAGAPGLGASAGPGAAAGMAARPGVPIPRQRRAPEAGPRQEYLDAFGDSDGVDDVFTPRPRNGGTGTYLSAGPAAAAAPGAPIAQASPDSMASPASTASTASTAAAAGRVAEAGTDEDDAPPTGAPAPGGSTKGRTFTGIAAAAVTTVLAVIVAGQVTDGHAGTGAGSKSATDQARDARDDAGTDQQAAPSVPAAAPALTYSQKMNAKYALSPTLKGSGRFQAVPGFAKAPGKGRKYTYRVDVEEGLGLDGALFAEAVQKTLNDDRSWAHDGARKFERVSSGRPDFVITLASPGTTAVWCAKSGLDTTEDNVSCDSAATERVMINAYRWAQGSKTYGDKMYAYRQMLINHEVGHRLGHGHVTCDKDGALAPVMQQQTKFLDHDGIHCLPNPWPYPVS